MWNWNARIFITDAKANLTIEDQGGAPSKYTHAEIEALEKTLKEHEAWLAEWVAKQKKLATNQDPVILTSEMRARAKTLENHLTRLMKRKVPKKKPVSSTSSSSAEPTVSMPAEPEPRDEL